VLRECERRSVGSARCLTKALRSLLRFAFLEGWTATDLTATVPAVANWQASSLPRALEAQRVALLVGSCDRSTATGRRDYAILHLLARLGLLGHRVYGGKGRRDEPQGYLQKELHMYLAGKAMPNVVPAPGARVPVSWPLVSVSIASVCTLSGTGPRSCWTCRSGLRNKLLNSHGTASRLRALAVCGSCP
jgi:hypothetical protein